MPIETETGTKLTCQDYAKIPADGKRHEIIEGNHIVSPAPHPEHQSIQFRASRQFGVLEDDRRARIYCAPIDVQLSDTDIVQPDIIAVADHNERVTVESRVIGPPDLVIEILSPSTRRIDRGSKRALYEVAGVREYWIIDPADRSLTQLVLSDDRYTETVHAHGRIASRTFAGFEFDLDSIF